MHMHESTTHPTRLIHYPLPQPPPPDARTHPFDPHHGVEHPGRALVRVRRAKEPAPARLEEGGGHLDVVGRELFQAGAQAGEGRDGGGHLGGGEWDWWVRRAMRQTNPV